MTSDILQCQDVTYRLVLRMLAVIVRRHVRKLLPVVVDCFVGAAPLGADHRAIPLVAVRTRWATVSGLLRYRALVDLVTRRALYKSLSTASANQPAIRFEASS